MDLFYELTFFWFMRSIQVNVRFPIEIRTFGRL